MFPTGLSASHPPPQIPHPLKKALQQPSHPEIQIFKFTKGRGTAKCDYTLSKLSLTHIWGNFISLSQATLL